MSRITACPACVRRYQEMADEVGALLLQAEANSPQEKRLADLLGKLTLAAANTDFFCSHGIL